MNEEIIETQETPEDIWSQIAPKCPVKVGDRFYRDNYGVQIGAVLKDYIRVTKVEYMPDKHDYYIHGKYESRAVGPQKRVFSAKIFESGDWKIEKRK